MFIYWGGGGLFGNEAFVPEGGLFGNEAFVPEGGLFGNEVFGLKV